MTKLLRLCGEIHKFAWKKKDMVSIKVHYCKGYEIPIKNVLSWFHFKKLRHLVVQYGHLDPCFFLKVQYKL